MKFIKDSEFIRGKVPMTKEDIRILTIAKMELTKTSKVLDIGTGTGSITVQSSKIAMDGIVYSIEKDMDAFNIAEKNIEKFNCRNIKLIFGDAVHQIMYLIDKEMEFDSIFIGGSGGALEKIIYLCSKFNPKVLVMNFITIDNTYKSIEALKSLGYSYQISQIGTSYNVSDTYMMKANNPIYIVVGKKEGN